ncbi:MAG: alpha/beta hydrolase family protein [Bacteroidia bacterium]
MKSLFIVFFTLLFLQIFAQNKQPKDFGFKHLQSIYQGDTVDILMQSKKGEENKIKPLFFFCQGSLPQPLIKIDGATLYGVFPFITDSIISKYHLVIVSKPAIPLIVEMSKLGNNHCYFDSTTNKFPSAYSKRNLLDYYVNRNLFVIDFLQNQKMVSKQKLVVAGHSQGGAIASKMASISKKITHLIIASSKPFGQIMSMVQDYRRLESNTDSTRYGEQMIDSWKMVVNDKENMDDSEGDTYKATYGFSIPPIEYLKNLQIPILVCYGTKDNNAPFNDYLQVEMIRQKRNNFTFKAYVGLDHNYFGFKPNGEINYDDFNWDKVALDWYNWLK